MRTRPLSVLLVTLALAVGAAACGSDETVADAGDGTTTTTAEPAGTPTTAEPAPTTTAPPRTQPVKAPDPRPQGPTFGFVHAVDASVFPNVVMLDDAELLTGEEARKAAREDGLGDPETPNDYYIRNRSRDIAELPLSAEVNITIESAGGAEQTLTPQQWEERIARQAQGEAPYYEPYHLTWEDGVIVAVRSQYLP